ncbi:uncharacterized protein [Diabrotica undecimpunctata]|uniref:uncharacterized protein n=1 Tax=Diabrotica undecimpunctata TaxID=50387 RepID=UPI003B63AAF8
MQKAVLLVKSKWIYAPTADKTEEEIEKFYDDLQNTLQNTTSRDIPVVMGDFNAKVGEGRCESTVGPYELRVRNERGERLIEFCLEHNLARQENIYEDNQSRYKPKRSGHITDYHGDPVIDIEQTKNIRKRYVEKTFDDDRDNNQIIMEYDTGPPITQDEIKAAIEATKAGKAPGPDNFHSEFLKIMGDGKAFDRIKHDKLMDILKATDLDNKDLRVIKNIYYNQLATIGVKDQLTEEVSIKRGVRQGCILSPLLFNVYSEHVMSQALEHIEEDILINGERLNNIRYTDDTILFADSLEGLQTLAKWNVNKANWTQYSDLIEQNFLNHSDSLSTVEKYYFLMESINNAFSQSIPTYKPFKIIKQPPPPWWDFECEQVVSDRKDALIAYTTNSNFAKKVGKTGIHP